MQGYRQVAERITSVRLLYLSEQKIQSDIVQICQRIFIFTNKKVGEAVVELDQFKSILATYTEPLVEVRDSL